MNKLPDHLPRRYIIKAIHLWDAGELISSSLHGCMRLNIMADVTPRRRLLASQRH